MSMPQRRYLIRFARLRDAGSMWSVEELGQSFQFDAPPEAMVAVEREVRELAGRLAGRYANTGSSPLERIEAAKLGVGDGSR